MSATSDEADAIAAGLLIRLLLAEDIRRADNPRERELSLRLASAVLSHNYKTHTPNAADDLATHVDAAMTQYIDDAAVIASRQHRAK